MPRKKKVETKVTVEETKEAKAKAEVKETLCFKCFHVVPEEHPVKNGNHFCSVECVT